MKPMATTKKLGYTLDHANRQIVITREFSRKTNAIESDEQNALADLLKKFPHYIATTKTIAKGNKNSYKGLTIEYMEDFIREIEGDASINVKKFQQAVRLYQDQHKYGSYPLIKKWFLTRYKDALPNPEIVKTAA